MRVVVRFALACGVGLASGRLDAAVHQGTLAARNVGATHGADSLPQRRSPDSLLTRAESLLATGRLPEARRLAEALSDRNPRDVRAMVLLGRIHLAWPIVGRFTAESLFARAAALAPGDPEPLYYIGMVGIALSGDDGEQMARRGFVPVLAIDPGYRDTWTRWLTLYRGDNERRAVIAALERHAGSWNADYWRGQMQLEQRRYNLAADILEDVVGRRPDDPGPRAWLARARFAAGQDVAGAAAYDTALAAVARDTGDVLWRQVRGIASAGERQAWTATPPARRSGFIRRFWAVREPDLATSINERLGEHFRRMSEAQRLFRLLHPNTRYFRSPLFRALSGGVGGMPGGLEGAERRALQVPCAARPASVRDEAMQAGLRPRIEGPGDSLPNLEDGLDDRGRIFLRHGAPQMRSVGSVGDETWCYFRADGSVLRVSFVRRTGGYGVSGDMVVTPMVRGEAESAHELLATDRFTAGGSLSFAFWPAAFRAEDRWMTDLFVIPDSLAGVATLVDDDGREVARDSGTGRALRLTASPGRYLLLMDGVRGRNTGRYRGAVTLPDFTEDIPFISSILLTAGGAPPVRDSVLAAATGGLVLPSSAPLRIYAELYNMGREDGTARYVVEYRFERTDGFIFRRPRERSTTVSFTRETAFTPRIIESLIVDPGRLPAGRYRLHIEVGDAIRGTRTASSVIEFRLR